MDEYLICLMQGDVCLNYAACKTELRDIFIQVDKCNILWPRVQIPGVISGRWRDSRHTTIVFGCRH